MSNKELRMDISVTAKELADLIVYNYERIKRSMFIWGPPGVGKTQVVTQATKKLGIDIRYISLAMTDAIDWRGVPHVVKEEGECGITKWARPGFLPIEGAGLLFLDDFNVAPPTIQASAYDVVLRRAAGEHELGDRWLPIAAGNRESDRGVVFEMPSPLRNRMIHVELLPDIDSWKEWAYSNAIHESVVGWLSWKADRLYDYEGFNKPRGFATPRSWEMASDILKAGMPEDLERAMVAGVVGDGDAMEFRSFVKLRNKLPDVEKILKTGKGPVPKDKSVLYALVGSLTTRLMADGGHAENFVKYVLTLPVEFSVLAVVDAWNAGRKNELNKAPSFMNWTRRHGKFLVNG